MNSEEVRLYIERANLDLKAAQATLDDGFYGVAVSRAYYAMFYAVGALLASRGLARSKHTAVHAAFGEHFVKTGLIEPQYLRRLVDAFEARSDADYDAAFVGDPARADAAVASAKDFVARVEQLLSLGGDR